MKQHWMFMVDPTRITILGCGASAGVPMIGCECAVCTSNDPRNQRSRVSVLIESAGSTLLVDTSPDLRQQALRHKINTIDAIIYTHAHADHAHGIDDVRPFNYNGKAIIPAYGDARTMSELQTRFDYAFMPPIPEYGWFRPALEAMPMQGPPFAPVHIGDASVIPFAQQHGRHITLGLRVGDIAYSTDTSLIPDESFALLEGVDIWVVDCLRYKPAPTHAHLDMALEWIERVKPRIALLTHMSHDFDYETLAASLPDGVYPAYDGLCLSEGQPMP